MKITIARFIAAILLVIPGLLATWGFLEMKNSLFAQFEHADSTVPWGRFILGLLAFAAGVAFIGGWIFFRDRKRNYVAPRFKAKKRSS